MTLSLHTLGYVALCAALVVLPGIVNVLGQRHRDRKAAR